MFTRAHAAVSEWGQQRTCNPPFFEESRWLLSTVDDLGMQRNTDAGLGGGGRLREKGN